MRGGMCDMLLYEPLQSRDTAHRCYRSLRAQYGTRRHSTTHCMCMTVASVVEAAVQHSIQWLQKAKATVFTACKPQEWRPHSPSPPPCTCHCIIVSAHIATHATPLYICNRVCTQQLYMLQSPCKDAARQASSTVDSFFELFNGHTDSILCIMFNRDS